MTRRKSPRASGMSGSRETLPPPADSPKTVTFPAAAFILPGDYAMMNPEPEKPQERPGEELR